jgi:hypothetical protein
MLLLFDAGRLIEECVLAIEAHRCVERGDGRGLGRIPEDLCSSYVMRTSHADLTRDRRLFVERHPAADAPLAAFDLVLARLARKGDWLDPANEADLVELAAKAAALRAALGGEPSATDWLGGSLTELTYAVSGNKARRPTSYFLGLQEAGRIEFRETAAIGRRKYQVRVLESGEHRLARERLAEFRARKRPGRDR